MVRRPHRNAPPPVIAPRPGNPAPHPRAFTLLEVLLTVLLLSITALIAMDAIADADAGLRAERAARESVSAIRFARSRALTDGVPYTVRFNVAAKTISVVDPNNSYAVLSAPVAGAVMQINLSGKTDVANVAITPAITGGSTDPYDVTYSAAGATNNYGTVTFAYGGKTKILQIPAVGDPILVGDTRRP